jgi:hypothetical protein
MKIEITIDDIGYQIYYFDGKDSGFECRDFGYKNKQEDILAAIIWELRNEGRTRERLIKFRKKLKALHGHYKIKNKGNNHLLAGKTIAYMSAMQEFDNKFPGIIKSILNKKNILPVEQEEGK